MGRPNDIPIVLPPITRAGQPITAAWANQIRTALDRLKNRGTIDPSFLNTKDTHPPFWPRLIKDDKFVITDGFVVDTEGGIANADCINVYYPTGIGTLGGERTEVTISEGQYIYIKCVIDSNGVCISQELKVDPSDKLSFNPNPVTPADGEFWYKIAYYVPTSGSIFAHLEYHLAGSHIYLRHRGGNLDLRVNVDHISGGAISHVSYHYLVFRNGDYIGKFEPTDTKPSSHGTPDTDTVTFIA